MRGGVKIIWDGIYLVLNQVCVCVHMSICMFVCVCACRDSNPGSWFPEPLPLHFSPPSDSVPLDSET